MDLKLLLLGAAAILLAKPPEVPPTQETELPPPVTETVYDLSSKPEGLGYFQIMPNFGAQELAYNVGLLEELDPTVPIFDYSGKWVGGFKW